MMHHKAPHRPWEPNDEHKAHFAGQRIPEPVTFWDSYATRTDALHENQQSVAADMTNRDLKLKPPDGLAPAELTRWLSTKPDSVTTDVEGRTVTLTGEPLARWKYQRYMQDYLATVQSVDDSVGRVLAYLDAAGLARNTIVIYTSDQGFFLGDHGLLHGGSADGQGVCTLHLPSYVIDRGLSARMVTQSLVTGQAMIDLLVAQPPAQIGRAHV